MVYRALLVILALSVLATGFAQEGRNNRQRPSRRGENAGYGTRDATVLSMMGWGIGLGIGIATLCALIPNNSGSSGGGSTSH